MNRHPKLWFPFFPKVIKNVVLNQKGQVPEYLLQRNFFSYLTLIDDFDEQIEKYWDKNENKISAWYLAQKKPDDLIISASPICIILKKKRFVIAQDAEKFLDVLMNA